MSFASFGIGVNALAQGINSGIDAGTKVAGLIKQGEINKAMSEGIEKSKVARQADIDKQINVGSESDPTNTMTVPTYEVGKDKFSTKEDAQASAEKQVDSVYDYFYKNAAPSIAQKYLEQGDAQTAAVWTKWINDEQVQTGVRKGLKAFQRYQTGDNKGALDGMMAMYNAPGYFEDGTKALGWTEAKNDKGEVTGYNVEFQQDDGTKTSSFIGVEDLGENIMSLANPEYAFNTAQEHIKDLRATRADIAKSDYTHNQAIELEGVKSGNKIDQIGATTAGQIEVGAADERREVNKPPAIQQKAEGIKKIAMTMGGMDEKAAGQYALTMIKAAEEGKPVDFFSAAVKILSAPGYTGQSKLAEMQETDPAKAQQMVQELATTLRSAYEQPATPAQAPAPAAPLGGGLPAGPGGAKPAYYKIDYKTGTMVPGP